MRKDDLNNIVLSTLLIAASPNPRPHVDEEPSHSAACEGCEHLWWEHDMGKSIPRCKLGMEMTTPCEGFKANSLYVSYIEKFGKGADE